MTRTLRPHQQKAYDAVHAEWGSGVVRTAVVHATGLGKGDLLAKLVTDEARAGGRALVLCHRAEVLDQLTARCREYAPEVPVGRVQSARNESRRPVTMAMIQTLSRESRQMRMPKPSMVVIDECHRASSDGYVRTLAWAGCFDRTRTVGLTATLVRGDKRGLGDVFETVADSLDIPWGVNEGLLVRPHGRVVVTQHMDLENAKVSRGDYQDSDLGTMVTQDAPEIVHAWREHAGERVTIAFVPTVDSAHELRDAFLDAGVRAEAVTGGTPAAERKKIYARLEAGETQVLVNVFVLVEGFDVPSVSCILQCRPTRLPGTYTQMVGRALRPHPSKSDALILDVVGASRHQRLMTLIDLSPSAVYNTEALDSLPCDLCGGAPRGKQLTDEAPFQCECPPEERDPNGGRLHLEGPALYEEVDLFASSKLNWLFTHAGTRFLPCGERIAILWPKDDLYRPGHRTTTGMRDGRWVGADGVWLSEPLELEDARRLAESWALDYDPSLASKGSSWRRGNQKPSEKQIEYAARLGVEGAETMTKARLSDEISIELTSRVMDK